MQNQQIGWRRLALTSAALVLLSGTTVGAGQVEGLDGFRTVQQGSSAAVQVGNRTIHATDGRIVGQRAIRVPGTDVVTVLWDEVDAQGERRSMRATSTDGGQNFIVRRHRDEIRLRYQTFDPAQGEPDVHPLLSSGADEEVYIVQFVAASPEAFRQGVRDAGGEVLSHMPFNAHLVRMDEESIADVAALPYVRWIGAYHPAYRMESALRSWILDGGQDGPHEERLRLSIQLLERGPEAQDRLSGLIEAVGGEVEMTTPEGFRMEAWLSREELLMVAASREVLFVDIWGPYEEDMDTVREFGGADYIESVGGYTGEGVRAEVMDSGLLTSHVDLQRNPPIVRTNSGSPGHGTPVYGIVFASGDNNPSARGLMPDGQGIFTAYSNMVGNRYQHTQALVEPPYEAVFQTNSWGSPRTTDYTTISSEMDDILFNIPIVILQSQSNAGNQMSRPQAWAKNMVSVGGIRHQDTKTRHDDAWGGGASIGPAADGRVKPELAYFYDNVGTTGGSNSTHYRNFSGTSAATPITAGHFGLAFQMWADGAFGNPVGGGSVFEERPRPETMRALMVNTASQWPFAGENVDLSRDKQGWGSPDLQRLLDLADRMFIIDSDQAIAESEVHTYWVRVDEGETEFRTTMVYPDLAGTTSSNLHRINDLSLRVISPSGVEYWGNHGLRGSMWSEPGGEANTIDTVHNVFVPAPEPGIWRLEVSADEINQDGWPDSPGMNARYGLVASGAVEAAPALEIGLIDQVPSMIDARETVTFDVRIDEAGQSLVSGSATLHWRVGDGAFNDVPLDSLGGDAFRAELPALNCGAELEFYVSAQGDGGDTVTLPEGGASNPWQADVGGMVTLYEHDFETADSWRVVNESVLSGAWVREVPHPTGAGSPPADFDGSGRAWLTGNGQNNKGLRGGPTELHSRIYTLDSNPDAMITYARWFFSDFPGSSDSGTMRVEISSGIGQPWQMVEEVRPGAGWVEHTFRVGDYVTPDTFTRMRFVVENTIQTAIVQAAVDSVRVFAPECSVCLADFNGDGTVDVNDFFAYLDAFEDGDPLADVNNDGEIDISDFFAFLDAFADGCP